MRYPDWAAEGSVRSLTEWGSATISDGAAIICRSNAPIFSMALKLLRQGRSCTILGKELGPALVKQMKKLGGNNNALPQKEFLRLINEWEVKELRTARESRKPVIQDRAECYRVFAEFGNTLQEAIAYAERVFAQEGKILLMTGHKSKGLEFPHVFHLDPWRIPSKWAVEAAAAGDDSKLVQEKNLDYVITTRAQESLTLVNLEDFA
jgi:superfamily I DNA/RNA helicase